MSILCSPAMTFKVIIFMVVAISLGKLAPHSSLHAGTDLATGTRIGCRAMARRIHSLSSMNDCREDAIDRVRGPDVEDLTTFCKLHRPTPVELMDAAAEDGPDVQDCLHTTYVDYTVITYLHLNALFHLCPYPEIQPCMLLLLIDIIAYPCSCSCRMMQILLLRLLGRAAGDGDDLAC